MIAKEVLKNYFGYDLFREGQEEVSLMQDQVTALKDLGINATYINSSLNDNEMRSRLDEVTNNKYKIVYVAPERLESQLFRVMISKIKVSMVTVDEAHCISQWGQDFRPSYLKIATFINSLSQRPILSAFTATANEDVKNDMLCMLRLNNPYVIVTGFDRKNLYFSVESLNNKGKNKYLIDYIKKHPNDSGIIYCATRNNVEEVCDMLKSFDVQVTKYHAGLSNEERKKNQEEFIYDISPIIVATNAFGMGIDKSNVRFVIHYNMPQSMENYYQEAGRAGRDGENSNCILLFSPQDVMINKFLLNRKDFNNATFEEVELIKERDLKRLRSMENYCKITTCLRNYILTYFGEKVVLPCNNCNNCQAEYTQKDMTFEAKWIINCITEAKERFGVNIIIGTLLGLNRARLRELEMQNCKSYGILKNSDEETLKQLVTEMIMEGYIYQTDDKYSVLKIGDITKLKYEDAHVFIKTVTNSLQLEDGNISNKKLAKEKRTDQLTKAGFDLFDKLKKLRLEIARAEGLPPYIVFSDKTLIDMCIKLPKNENEMLNVSGVGEVKYERYGKRFLDEIQKFAERNKEPRRIGFII